MIRKTVWTLLALGLAAIPASAQGQSATDNFMGGEMGSAISSGAMFSVAPDVSGGLEAGWMDDEQSRESELYDDATEAVDDAKWDTAVEKFGEVARLNGTKADAALYWKAYAQNKLGERAQALATIAELRQKYAKSRWVADAKALAVEVGQSNGRPVNPDNESDCELKLLAINALGNQNSSEAVPMLEKFLRGGSCPKMASRTLFVLAQMGTPEARAVIGNIAKGQVHLELQRKAIRDLGMFAGRDGIAELSEIYASSNDIDIKKEILRSFMVGGQKERLFEAAKGEKSPELRAEAIRQLGLTGAQDEIWQIYQSETSRDVKAEVIQAMFIGGDTAKLTELARSEKDPDLRRKAIRNLGLMGGARSGGDLRAIYQSDKDRDDRMEVLNAFFIGGDAHELVEIARKETDPELKKAAVSKLSVMGSKEGTQYLMELLNK